MKKLLLLTVAAISLFFASCTKEDENIVKYKSSGFIKGTIKGEDKKGNYIDETFNYTQYFEKYGDKVYETEEYVNGVKVKGDYVNISRQNDDVGRAYLSFFVVDNKIYLKNYKYPTISLKYNKLLINNNLLEYNSNEADLQNDNPEKDIIVDSNFKYDKTTGNVSGKITFKKVSVENDNNTTIKHNITYVVEFSTKVYRVNTPEERFY